MSNSKLKEEGKIIALALLAMFLGVGLSFSGAEKLGYFIGIVAILVANIFGIIAIIKTTKVMKNNFGNQTHDDVDNETYRK